MSNLVGVRGRTSGLEQIATAQAITLLLGLLRMHRAPLAYDDDDHGGREQDGRNDDHCVRWGPPLRRPRAASSDSSLDSPLDNR